jgi:hypothetical protein
MTQQQPKFRNIANYFADLLVAEINFNEDDAGRARMSWWLCHHDQTFCIETNAFILVIDQELNSYHVHPSNNSTCFGNRIKNQNPQDDILKELFKKRIYVS